MSDKIRCINAYETWTFATNLQLDAYPSLAHVPVPICLVCLRAAPLCTLEIRR